MLCCECKLFFKAFKSLQTHLRIVHKYDSSSTYFCQEVNCFRRFTSLRSFRNHCGLKHSNSSYQAPSKRNLKQVPNPSAHAQCEGGVEVENNIFGENKKEKVNIYNFKDCFNEELLLFISKLYNLAHLPKSYIQLIINYLSDLFSNLDFFEKYIIDNTDSVDFKKNVSDIFSFLKNPFESYKSEYLRMKEMEKTENFIKPITYNVGQSLSDVRNKKNILYKSVTITAQFIPLRSQLKKFFEIQIFFSEIKKYLANLHQENLQVSNIIQSPLWKKIETNFSGKTVFPLLLYFDDYESGNPLGARAGVHKLGAVYISLPCLPPQYSSKLSNIFLALLFHTDDRKCFGNRAVFNVLLDELLFLENEGIDICTDRKTEKVYFALALVLGDNLGMNSILGFNECFVANSFCRICKMKQTETFFSYCPSENFPLRTRFNYASDLELNNSSITGIKEECIFHVLKNFHLTENISVDPMHDLLEGVCHYDLILILNNFIVVEKYISLENFNYKLQIFSYEINDLGNRPSLLPTEFYKKKKLPFSASEMLCFVKIFSFLIGEYIPSNNTYWELYKYLRKIIDIVLKESISSQDINYLKFCISEHNRLYLHLSKKHLTPKFHFLTHYPSVISQIGPISGNIWSMRYESKHQESKRTGNVSCNRKNITYSLAMKHQLKVCFRLISKEIFPCDIIFGSLSSVENLNDFLHFSGPLEEIFWSVPWFSCSWITYHGYKYKVNTVFLTHSIDLLPQFGIVTDILISNQNQISFKLKLFETIAFNEHFLAYEGHSTNDSIIIFLKDILDYKPYSSTKINNIHLFNN